MTKEGKRIKQVTYVRRWRCMGEKHGELEEFARDGMRWDGLL
jgi:hypothetical protein